MNQLNKKNDLFNESGFSLSIIPVSSKKIPFSKWKKYQQVTAPIDSWRPHYLTQGTIEIITGKVSSNLECIDVDAKNDPHKTIITQFTNLKGFFDLLKENARKDYMLASTKAKQLLYRALLEKNNDDDKIVNNESIEK